MDRPGGTQQVMEILLTNSMGLGIRDLLDDVVGHGAEKFLPMIGTISVFILASNMLGLVPGLMSPTADKVVPLGCATVIFLYYNSFGIGKHGAGGYAKTLLGPVPAISPIMVIVETISHFARVLSLTVRLWANMMVSDLIFVTFLGLSVSLFSYLSHLNPVGYIAVNCAAGHSIGALGLSHLRSDFAGIHFYGILPIVYIGLAVAEEH